MEPSDKLRKAEQLLKTGHRNEAWRLIDAVMQADPHNYEATYWRGVCQKMGGDLEAAENDFWTVVRHLPNHDRAHYGLGLILESRGDVKGAMEAYKQALHANPAHQQARQKLSQYGAHVSAGADKAPAPPRTAREYSRLKSSLEAGDWRKADEETARIIHRAVGSRKLRVKDVEKLPCEVLRAVDPLWVQYSEGRFGFSIQKRLYESQGGLTAPHGFDPTTFSWLINRIAWRATKRTGYRRVGSALLGSVHLRYELSAPPGHLPAAWVLPRKDTLFPREEHGFISFIGIVIYTLLYGAAAVLVLGVIGGLLFREAGMAGGAILGAVLALQIPATGRKHAKEGKRTMKAQQNLMMLFSRMRACGL
jgi:hypothetical protein